MIGPAGQGIAAGQYGELTDAIDAGVTYVNVHSTQYPGGEIRAQLETTARRAVTTVDWSGSSARSRTGRRSARHPPSAGQPGSSP